MATAVEIAKNLSANLSHELHAIVTRLRRGDVDIVPTQDTVLEMGDRIRVLTYKENIARATKYFGDSLKSITETDYLSSQYLVHHGVPCIDGGQDHHCSNPGLPANVITRRPLFPPSRESERPLRCIHHTPGLDVCFFAFALLGKTESGMPICIAVAVVPRIPDGVSSIQQVPSNSSFLQSGGGNERKH